MHVGEELVVAFCLAVDTECLTGFAHYSIRICHNVYSSVQGRVLIIFSPSQRPYVMQSSLGTARQTAGTACNKLYERRVGP